MVNLISLNVRGISNFRKRRIIYTWCRKRKADIIFLQETLSKLETDRQWKNEWGANSRGVAILIKKGVDCKICSKISDPSGRFIILKVIIEENV